MQIFTLLITNLFPLYIIIALGYIGGRYMQLNLESIARILIFMLQPIVAFGAVSRIDFQPEYLMLPFVIAGVSAVISVASHVLSRKIFSAKRSCLIGMASASGNTGYFGLPIIMALFGPDAIGIYLMINMGIQISESTLAYYLGARGEHTVLESVKRVFRLPAIYAMALGLLVNFSGFSLPEIFYTYWDHATGAWIIFGMMLIGIALGKTAPLQFNWRLNAWLGAVKFIVWPLAVLSLIALDRHVLHLFDADIHKMFLVIGIVPLPGNVVAYAAQLNVHPEETAMAVLLSTLFALVYIPVVFLFF